MSHKKRNWSEYNKSLVNRGRLSVWVNQQDLCSGLVHNGKKGRPRYSDSFIYLALVLRNVYQLPFRALEGFFQEILELQGVHVASPNYTLFCKRMKHISLPKLSLKRPQHILIDATGIKVYGEGEWKRKIHGVGKRRQWLKIHAAIDATSQEVVSLEVTASNIHDSCVLPSLVSKSPRSVRKVFADGAYDGYYCRNYLAERSLETCIPPPKNAVLKQEKAFQERNDFLGLHQVLGGDERARALVKKLLGYHKRSLVETAFSRLKRIFSDRLKSKMIDNQIVEVNLKCWILNKMMRLAA